MIFLILGPIFLAVGIYFAMSGGVLMTVAWTFIPLGAVFTAAGLFLQASGARRAKLLTAGVDATATVTDAKQTSMQVNDQPVVAITLEITPPMGAPFTATTRTPVPIMTLSQVRLVPGAKLPVKLDPAKPESFIIDWGRAVQQQAVVQ